MYSFIKEAFKACVTRLVIEGAKEAKKHIEKTDAVRNIKNTVDNTIKKINIIKYI